MRYISTFITFLLSFSFVLSQGNLQFNQTKNHTKTISVIKKTHIQHSSGTTVIDTAYLFWDSITVVVPPNKTLKIENISLGSTVQIWNEDATGTITNLAYETPAKFSNYGYQNNYIGSPNQHTQVSLFNSVIYESNVHSNWESLHAFPIWLQSGTYNFVIFGNAYTNRDNTTPLSIEEAKIIKKLKKTCFISSIEFNIIP